MAIPFSSPASAGSGVAAEAQASAAVRNPLLKAAGKAGALGLQLLALWAINFLAGAVVKALAVPVPGNLVGMVALYVLLSMGVVKVEWVDATGSLLVRHLAFFFIPIAVGVMNMAGLLAEHGVGIVLTLIASAAIGIGLCGLVTQRLAARFEPGDGR